MSFPRPHCPSCGSPVPLRLAIRSTDVLLFPEAGAHCRSCHAPLRPTRPSIAAGTGVFLAILAAGVLAVSRFSREFPARLLEFCPAYLVGLFSADI